MITAEQARVEAFITDEGYLCLQCWAAEPRTKDDGQALSQYALHDGAPLSGITCDGCDKELVEASICCSQCLDREGGRPHDPTKDDREWCAACNKDLYPVEIDDAHQPAHQKISCNGVQYTVSIGLQPTIGYQGHITMLYKTSVWQDSRERWNGSDYSSHDEALAAALRTISESQDEWKEPEA